MPSHKDLTGADLHEPKGVENADNKMMYFADGLGSGAWKHHSGSVHGEMVIVSNAVATVTPTAVDATLATDSDYVKVVAGWSVGHIEGVTFNTDELVVPVAGEYEIHFWADVKFPAANQRVGLKYAVNDTTPYSTRKLVQVSASVNDVLNYSGAGIVQSLTPTDTLSIYIATDAAGDPTIEEAGLLIKLLDPA